MKPIASSLLAFAISVSSTCAATSQAPLPAGKAAGIKEATLLGSNIFLVLLSAGVVIGGLTLTVANNSGGGGVTTPTTTSTATSALP